MTKYIDTQTLLKKKTLTYREILNIKKRLNGYSKNSHELKKDFTDNETVSQPELVPMGLYDYEWKEEYLITPEHTQKGLDWLYKVTFKPSLVTALHDAYDQRVGSIDLDPFMRKNSPLGYREAYILLDFDHFTFAGFYDASLSNYGGFHNYLPLWRCYDKDGDSFEYYVQGGEMNITG